METMQTTKTKELETFCILLNVLKTDTYETKAFTTQSFPAEIFLKLLSIVQKEREME